MSYAHALRTFHPFGFSNLRALQVEAVQYLAEQRVIKPTVQFDWVFIDAQKSKTLDFFLAVQPFLAPQATIVVDDALKYALKMQTFYTYLKANNITYSLHSVDLDDATMVF